MIRSSIVPRNSIHVDDDQSPQSQQRQDEDNDIFTRIIRPQGRINGDHNEDVINGNGAAEHLNPSRLEAASSSVVGSTTGVSCQDEHGNYVSWFIVYKLPILPNPTDPLLQQGSKYYYLIPNGTSWSSSEYAINGNESILAKTLGALWQAGSRRNEDLAYVAYNDQPPSIPAIVVNGHTKGIIISNSNGGMWLQHSCPHFPNLSSANYSSSYPSGGLINGQMFSCFSLGNVSSIDLLGNVLEYTKPFVYNYSISTEMVSLLPTLSKVAAKNATMKKAPWYSTFDLQADQLDVKVFAKGPKFRKDVYSAWIAPEFETSLDTQSWLNGRHPLKSDCGGNYSVFNVLMKNMSGQHFPYSDDHSKWAVSLNQEMPVTCVGDLNRMTTKDTWPRGGVTLCVSDVQIWTAFKSIVEGIQPCNSTLADIRKTVVSNKKHKHNLPKP